MAGPRFIGSRIYTESSYGPNHPLSIPRVPTVISLCRALGWFTQGQYLTSPMAKPKALEVWHDPDYIAALQRAEETQVLTQDLRAFDLGTLSNPIFSEVYSRPATAAGGGLLAAELVRNVGVAYNPGGGTHHGMPDRAAGFCYINEPVLTIKALLAQGLDRVAYVDIDAHHGDGVELAFASDPRVLVLSVHEEARWPFTGPLGATGNVVNLPVPKGFNDTEFKLVLDQLILPRVQAHRPQAIYLQAGADALTEDPLSKLALSNNVYPQAIRHLRPLAPRLIVSGGGGYNPWSVGRAWTRVWAELAGYEEPASLPDEARTILRRLSWPRRWTPTSAHLTTLADAPRNGPIREEIRERIKALHHP